MGKRKKRQAVVREESPRLMKRFELGEGCDADSVVMKEIRNCDKVEVGIWVDAHSSTSIDSAADVKNALIAEQYEALRFSLVQVDDEPVNTHGVPFMAMDDWGVRTMRYIQAFFDELNGVEESDVKNAVRTAEIWTSDSPISSVQEEDSETDQRAAG